MAGEATILKPVLQAASAEGEFTLDELVARTGIERGEVVKAAGRLIIRGLFLRAERGSWSLSEEGRRVRESGEPIRSGPRGRHTGTKAPKPNRFAQRAWSAMRIRRTFTVDDIVLVARRPDDKEPENNARTLLRRLAQAGYLVELGRVDDGVPTSNGLKRYMLTKDTGPIAPTYERRSRGFLDRNDGQKRPCSSTNAA